MCSSPVCGALPFMAGRSCLAMSDQDEVSRRLRLVAPPQRTVPLGQEGGSQQDKNRKAHPSNPAK